ncbi:phosphotransferase [Streptomyces sp. NPDC002835]
MDRRAFLATSGLAAIAPIDLVHLVTPTAPWEIPTQIRPREIGQLKSLADVIHRQDNEYGGGGAVRELARGAIMWGASLLPVPCPEALRPELLASVARLGIVVGASQFDAYAHDDARVSFRLAAECAEEAGEWHLRAKTYSFMARHEIWVGDPDTGLTHAEKGLVRSDRLTATERAMLHTALARAFGKMRDVANTLRAVGEADVAFEQSDPAQDPPWMAYYDYAQHHGDTAHALFDLAVHADQDPGQAARRFEIAAKGHGNAFARSRAISETKLASGYGKGRRPAARGRSRPSSPGRRRQADLVPGCRRPAGTRPVLGQVPEALRGRRPARAHRRYGAGVTTTPTPTQAVLQTACLAVGLDATDAEPIRLAENAIWRLPGGVVVRIAQPGQSVAATREVQVARWLATQDVPAVRDLRQPVAANGHPVTFWQELPPHEIGTVADVVALLKQLHALPKPDLPLGELDPFVRLPERIDAASTISDDDRQWLKRRLKDLKAQWAVRPRGLPECLVHGDAWVGNVARTEAGPLWMDFERASYGPRSGTSCQPQSSSPRPARCLPKSTPRSARPTALTSRSGKGMNFWPARESCG